MNDLKWPDGSARSQGNAFDLSKREHSIFFDPKRGPPPPIQKQKFGKVPDSLVGAVKGLSKQAREQLGKAPRSISISTKADSTKRSKAKRSAI